MAGKQPSIPTRLQDRKTWTLALKLTWVAIQIILILIFATAEQAFFYQEF